MSAESAIYTLLAAAAPVTMQQPVDCRTWDACA